MAAGFPYFGPARRMRIVHPKRRTIKVINCLTNFGSIAAPLLQELRWIARKITLLSPSPSVGEGRGEGETRHGHPSPSQRLSLRGRSPSLRAGGLSEPEAGAEPEPAATSILPPAYRQAVSKGEDNAWKFPWFVCDKPVMKDCLFSEDGVLKM